MTEYEIAHRVLRRAMRGVPAASHLARDVLEWARTHVRNLFGLPAVQAKKLTWTTLARLLDEAPASAEDTAGVLRLAGDFARVLRLGPLDTAIVEVLIAVDR